MSATIGSRRGTRSLSVAALLVFASGAISALFIMEEIRKVPVQRLAQNIERQLADKPDDVELRLNLARLYAMAYALKVTEFDARDRQGRLEPFFGHVIPHVPGPVREAQSRESQERARVDLARAIKTYEDVIARAPSNAVAHLGYAWALEQRGDERAAISAYRKAVQHAWPKDRAERAFMQDPVTMEAVERLKELLDPAADAKELASLLEKEKELRSRARMVTPIAIPLEGDFAQPPVDPEARVVFDADGSGLPRRWTWISPGAGWLVYDADGGRRITSALQWFGSVTFWLFWENGYHALAALDDDGDGELRGPELSHLAIWQDRNQDGVSEPGEVKPLSAHRIVALSCRYERGSDEWLAAYAPKGVTFADGSARPTFDVILRSHGDTISLTLTPE